MGNTDRLVGRWLVISGPNGKRYSLVTHQADKSFTHEDGTVDWLISYRNGNGVEYKTTRSTILGFVAHGQATIVPMVEAEKVSVA